ncbi:MAG: hypothetical protein KAS48_09930 [Gammaproteobacteria bacterium]|nr:hypothetical protein [Gammaproteobacteria bacterium]MCK5092332.1 hypothetical protein [Gammaproteobacteria bacterium]
MSRAAKKELKALSTPLYVEMELYFSCMVCKVVHFHQNIPEGRGFVPISDRLAVSFNPVAAAACSFNGKAGSSKNSNALLSTSSGQISEKFMPQWLEIDFSRGEWSGSFGYSFGG